MRSEWSCWRQRAIGEENPADWAVEIYLIGMKKDTEEFPILSRAKPKRAGAPQVLPRAQIVETVISHRLMASTKRKKRILWATLI
jgi:hypothetical protein